MNVHEEYPVISGAMTTSSVWYMYGVNFTTWNVDEGIIGEDELILPENTFLRIPDGEIHQNPCNRVGSSDNWFFLMHNDDVCSLMNLHSRASYSGRNLATTGTIRL